MPRPSSHLPSAGTGTARRAESGITIELAYINPSTVNGTSRAVHPASPAPAPDRKHAHTRHRRDGSNTDHGPCRRPPDNTIRRHHAAPSWTANCVSRSHGVFGAVPRTVKPPHPRTTRPSAADARPGAPVGRRGSSPRIADMQGRKFRPSVVSPMALGSFCSSFNACSEPMSPNCGREESGDHAAGLLNELACGRSACSGWLVCVALVGTPHAAATAAHAAQFGAD